MTVGYGVFERSRDVAIVVDDRGDVVYRNPAATAIAPGDARTWTECFPDEARVAAQAALADARQGTSAGFEWATADRSFAAEVTPFDGGVLCIARDQTQMVRSLERARRAERMLVDTQGVAHLGTWEWDVTQPHASWSEELYRIYALTPETYTPSYESYLTMVHPDDRARVMEATNRVFNEHVPYSHDERIFRPDGTMRYLHTWAFPLVDSAGALTHLIGVCQDITDRASIEEALQRANGELEARVAERTHRLESALRDREAFNAMITHDLRSPLTVVRIATDLLAKEIPADRRRDLERIRLAVDRMSELMNDLLAFARADESALQSEPIDVTAMAAEIVADLRATSPQRSIVISIEPGLSMVADRTLFHMAFTNLVSNAWKYTQQRADASIEIGATERDGARWLRVRDNGIGFDTDDAVRLFQPFQRLENAADFAGTGVGLATVKRIVERHGGRVTAEGTRGEGATFLVCIPT